MPKFHVVKGKKGVLVGDPQRNGFIGQRKLVFTADDAPKKKGDQYEPVEMLCRSTPDLRKALKLKQVEEVKSFDARNMKAAVAELDSHRPAAKKLKKKVVSTEGGGS